MSYLVRKQNVVGFDIKVYDIKLVYMLQSYTDNYHECLNVPPGSVITCNDLFHKDLDLLLRELVVRGGDPLEQVASWQKRYLSDCWNKGDGQTTQTTVSTEEKQRKNGSQSAQLSLILSIL